MKIRSTASTCWGITHALAVFLFLSAGLFLLALPVQAKTFQVTTTEDLVDKAPGDGTCAATTGVEDRCSLRAAIQEANALTGADEIQLPFGRYTLVITGTDEDAAAAGDLDITSTLTISGSGAHAPIIQGGPNWNDRILQMLPGSHVIVSGVTISGGAVLDAPGAGVLVDGEDGDLGPAQVELSQCHVLRNNGTAAGGGIADNGILTVTDCTIDFNRTTGDAAASGGGVYVGTDATLHMGNSTVTNNRAQSAGGGINIANDAKPPSTLNNVTLVDNTLVETDSEQAQGAGLSIANGVLTVTNSILARNKTGSGAGDECYGNLAAVRYSLIQVLTPDCTIKDTDITGVITGTPPHLGTFGFNGGLTPTYSLQAISPAVNGGNPAPMNPALDPESCFAEDQRGEIRTDRCDMGAFELTEQQAVSGTLYLPVLARR